MYFVGIAIFIFGLAFLLRNLGFLNFDASFWSVFYPLVIIVFGVAIIAITHEGRKLLKKLKQIFNSRDK